jgi:hypothetical protein
MHSWRRIPIAIHGRWPVAHGMLRRRTFGTLEVVIDFSSERTVDIEDKPSR